jgi:hypothetical protein
MFFQAMDVIKTVLYLLFLVSLPGKAQFPDSLTISFPDTALSIENTLFLVEDQTHLYFSYNPEIFKGEQDLEWTAGEYSLDDILSRIRLRQEVLFTTVGNQVVFYRQGQEPEVILQTGMTTSRVGSGRITGRILSKTEEEALPYSTIWIPSTGQGTVANAEGDFRLALPSGIRIDTIAFSCMGFKTRIIPVDELRDSINHIYLEPSIIPIQEVVIRRTDPVNLLQQALKRIPQNYSREPVVETAFYRETIQKNGNYISVSEAVLDIYKPGFLAMASEQARVVRGRKNTDLNEMDTLMVKLKGGLATSFLLDVIRNRPDFLQPDQFKNFVFRMSDIVTIEDASTYAIDFKQKETTRPPHYHGRIYIELQSLAIRGVEFEVDPRTIASVAGSMVHKKPRRVRVKPLSASYMVRYQAGEDHYYLSLITADNSFRVRPRKKLFGSEFRTVSEMAITGRETGEVTRFRPRETANSKDIFIDMLGGYDPGFWGPYNYIIPEEPLEDALLRISRLMDTGR